MALPAQSTASLHKASTFRLISNSDAIQFNPIPYIFRDFPVLLTSKLFVNFEETLRARGLRVRVPPYACVLCVHASFCRMCLSA